jgi:pre-mRNA-splicing factor CWC26
MSSSKLDYLSKYTAGDDKRKKKKKKKKTRVKEEEEEATARLHDDEEDDVTLKKSRAAEDDDDDYFGRPIGDDDEEGPVVVDVAETGVIEAVPPSAASTTGTWDEMPLSSAKRRHDASSAADPRRQPQRRHDSSDDDDDHNAQPPPRRRRHDSDASSNDEGKQRPEAVHSSSRHRRRRRHDSDAESDIDDGPESSFSAAVRKKGRHDPDDPEEEDHDHGRTEARNPSSRSTAAAASTRRRRHDSDSDSSVERMSSGHKAGLQGYRDFNKSELEIQRRKQEDARRMVDKYGMGETVYRDKHGRRTKEEEDGGVPSVDPKEQQRLLQEGRVQREALEAKAHEMAQLQRSTFARHQDDEQLEELRRREIRMDDPMARYAVKRQRKTALPTRPVYKGPPPKPNRYGIRPGYRWDGIDRGNGFEDKILAHTFNQQHREEKAYRWRSADM